MLLQTGCTTDKLSYGGCRDQVLNVAKQKAEMVRPTPMDVGAAEAEGGDGGSVNTGSAMASGTDPSARRRSVPSCQT